MAYMRGHNYIWTDESGFHFWVKDGYDGWDASYCDEDDKRLEGYEQASGVSIAVEAMDMFVMMRLAQMIYEGNIDDSIENAVSQYGGNTGCDMLRKNAAKLREALGEIKLDSAKPYVWDET